MCYFRFLMVAGLFLVISGAALNNLPQHEEMAVKINLLR